MNKKLFEDEEKIYELKVNTEVERRLSILKDNALSEITSNPDLVIEAYQKSLEHAKREIIELKPKAEFFDIVAESESLVEMSKAAKTLNFKGMGRNNIFEFLRDHNILRYNNEPYQQYVNAGYFKIIEKDFKIDGQTMISSKTMVTQKGLKYIIKKLMEQGYELNASD